MRYEGGDSSMPLASHVAALLHALRPEDFDTLPPAERRRFADLARRVAELAEPRPEPPNAGVLHALRFARGHE
jgi:hypothetical protein